MSIGGNQANYAGPGTNNATRTEMPEKQKKQEKKKKKERKKVCNTKGESINNPQHQGFMQYANQWHQPPNTDTASIQGRASAQ